MRKNDAATIYIAGQMGGKTDYKEQFREAEELLKEGGYIPLSPAILPEEGFSYAAYMRMTTAMLNECDGVCMLEGWENSRGATHEYIQALMKGKKLYALKGGKMEEMKL